MNIRVITVSGTIYVDSNSIDPNQIGQKGLGLLKIPSPWYSPFVCIESGVFSTYVHEKDSVARRKIIEDISSFIRENLEYLNIELSNQIIIRSSGIEEGMFERGQYHSFCSTQEQIEETLTLLFDKIHDENPSLLDIAFVVQKFYKVSILGHLSNERRFSKAKRDWVYEYTTPAGRNSGKIGIRHWRNKPPINTEQELLCKNVANIEANLKCVADYYTRKKWAIHFEFLWDGTRIILVQADIELLNNCGAENPKTYDISVRDIEHLADLKTIRPISQDDLRFKKIANQLLYKEIGLAIVPLYILSGEENMNQIRAKKLSPELEADLRKLTRNVIVIRSDVATSDKERRQLLPRSNDLHSYEDAVQWLFNQIELFSPNDEIAFIFHVFVPAIGAAFADASPNGRIVEIEALWGLPEGLYYNAHDKITVDTKAINCTTLSADYIEIKRKACAYKEFYIAPNDAGKWVAKRTAQPFDWQCCIDDNSIRQVAMESRKIAARANERVSIMWFIGIDKAYYNTSNLVWFHEPYDGSYTASKYKKKYFYETATVIKNEEDYENFLNMDNVRELKLCPTDDALLRDRDFLKKIGAAAIQKNASILLEGTMLAHPLYQLQRTGAKVFTTQSNDEYGEEEYYNKLVRDRIPDRIIQNGECITCYKLEKDALLRALMEKSVEEACEIVLAQSPDDLLEELGDQYEVISSIERILENTNTLNASQIKNIQIHPTFLRDSSEIAQFQFNLLSRAAIQVQEKTLLGEMIVSVSYEGVQLQIEVHLLRDSNSPKIQSIKETSPSNPDRLLRQKILKEAFALSSRRKKQSVLKSAKRLLVLIEEVGSNNPLWDKSTFFQKMDKKRQEKGGFQKGYMLTASTLKNPDKADSQLELSLPVSDFKSLNILEYSCSKNIDYLEKGQGELLIRLSVPLCFDHYETVFDSNSTKKYIGSQNSLILLADRKEHHLKLSVFEKQENNTYMQTIFGG